MARLKAGVQPTPLKTRLAVYRQELVTRGGRRLLADIEADANQALETIMKRETPALSQKDAVSAALVSYARAKPAKRAK